MFCNNLLSIPSLKEHLKECSQAMGILLIFLYLIGSKASKYKMIEKNKFQKQHEGMQFKFFV